LQNIGFYSVARRGDGGKLANVFYRMILNSRQQFERGIKFFDHVEEIDIYEGFYDE
jgi:hypothetical protein